MIDSERSNPVPINFRPITVRPAGDADAEVVLQVWNDSFVASGASGRAHPYTIEDYRRVAASADLMLAERDGTAQGTVAILEPGCTPECIARPGELEISCLAVRPAARRKGLARVLLACAQSEATRRGANALVLWTWPSQAKARDLYESLPYRRAVDRDEVDGFGGQRLVYRLLLQRGGGSGPPLAASGRLPGCATEKLRVFKLPLSPPTSGF